MRAQGWCVCLVVSLCGCTEDANESASSTARDGGAPYDPTSVAIVTQAPPISGGTLAVSLDGALAVASDPDTDRVLVVDLLRDAVRAAVQLRVGDEPGRVALDDRHRAHVALRRGGAVVTVDTDTGVILDRRPVCGSPRGVAWDPARDIVHVTCADGELVTLPAGGGAPTRRLALDRDLRDVVVQDGRVVVTRFRSTEVLVLDGDVVTRRFRGGPTVNTDAVAWRVAPSSRGGLWMLHQTANIEPLSTAAGGYSLSQSKCPTAGGAVRPRIEFVELSEDPVALVDVPSAPLAVDLAVTPSGERLAVAIPGAFEGAPANQVLEYDLTTHAECPMPAMSRTSAQGQVIAVAWRDDRSLLAQTRTLAGLMDFHTGVWIPFGGPTVHDAGHQLFHTNRTGRVTCASCHPEGEDDGRVWRFDDGGALRTPYLRGGILGSEPFHWRGELATMDALVTTVMVRRMGAPRPAAADVGALARWIDALPPRDVSALRTAAAARGEALFLREDIGCARCHAGPRTTNNLTMDVGTGRAFQVPSLRGLAWHPPYLHDGCAPTLRDRFGTCGGGEAHGHTAHLAAAELDDLVAYLETL